MFTNTWCEVYRLTRKEDSKEDCLPEPFNKKGEVHHVALWVYREKYTPPIIKEWEKTHIVEHLKDTNYYEHSVIVMKSNGWDDICRYWYGFTCKIKRLPSHLKNVFRRTNAPDVY